MTVITRGQAQAQTANSHQLYAYDNYYTGKDVITRHLAAQQFRVFVQLRASQTKLELTPYLYELQWQETSGQAWMQGTLNLRAPIGNRSHFQIQHGDVVQCQVFWLGKWQPVWDMRVWDPDRTIAPGAPELQCQLYDDFYVLSLSQDDFHYTHLHCHEILLRIFSKYKVPVGKVAMGTYRIPNFNQTGVSPLDAVVAAYQSERTHTGRRFVIRWQGGKAHVMPLQRNWLMFSIYEQLQNAVIHHTTPNNFATSLTGRVSVSQSNGTTKKLSYTATHGVESYGFVHQISDYSKNYNQRQLDSAVKSELATRQQIGHTIEFDNAGIALLNRGDSLFVQIPPEGYSDARAITWITDITHTVQVGQIQKYGMHCTVAADDPIALPHDFVAAKNARQRAAKRPKHSGLVKLSHR